ncbi:MAG: DUF3830 family protein [Candidatus Bathyarchaeota archaeon]|nr:DUF3830 family protein [Candidatus Bathyarchaeota archaeon]
MEPLSVNIGDYQFKAELHMEEAPETCIRILEALPITGRVIQARWSGEAVWLQMDTYGIEVPQENATSYPSMGQLLYYPGGVSEKEILIPYGSACFASKFGLLPGNHFATIVLGEGRLREMGERVLWEGAKEIAITEA